TILSAGGMNGRLRSMLVSSSSGKEKSDSDNQKKFSSPQKTYKLPTDTPPNPNGVNLHYPIYDRTTDFLTAPNENSFDLQDPSIINKDIEYDPQTNQYIINETIGDDFYRDPTYMSFEDFLNYEYKTDEEKYWQQRSSAAELLSQKGII